MYVNFYYCVAFNNIVDDVKFKILKMKKCFKGD